VTGRDQSSLNQRRPRRADRPELLRGLVVAIATAGALAGAVTVVVAEAPDEPTPTWMPLALTILMVVASAAAVRVRLRSTNAVMTWTDAAITVCIVCLPPGWVPVCVGTGVALAKLLRRVAPVKVAYNAGKDILAATAGLLVAIPLGVADVTDPLAHPGQVVLVAATVTITQHLIGTPVLALASSTRWTRILRADADMTVASLVGKTLVVLLTLAFWQVNERLLAVIPPVALCLHLMYASQVRARTERAAWQRLAATTEELNDTDLEQVLAVAVVNAAKLFGADEVDVFLRDGPDGPLLVRGDNDAVSWSGDPGQVPPRRHDGDTVTARLSGEDLKADLGEVRLHYAGHVKMSDRERLTLRTFVSALRTAVRNAAAYAEARRLALRNAHAAQHDPLTGLANRHQLLEYAGTVLRRPGVTALVVIDLDLFREVNETLGHLAGDRLLAEVARRLSAATGPEDLVARLGGDEFAALLVDLPAAAMAEQRARELLATLDAPIDLGGMRVRVEASAGVAIADAVAGTAPSEGAPLAALTGDLAADRPAAENAMIELLRRADVAMYQAKRGGPRIVRYVPERDTADIAALMLGGDLPRAIAEREFTVVFQPIVDLATGTMISAEALARWHHPERGDLDPRRFLAAVERSGLLPAFAQAVLDQALAAMLRWRALGVAAPVAVNASPRNLLDPTFPRMVADRLAAHDLRGRDLIIELTETLTLGQVELVGGVLSELRATGVRLALDDFGTSASSLSMLARVPVDELKVDRGFVAEMGTVAGAVAAVRSTVELGRSLDLFVVAEGVERDDQRMALWEMGCPAGQGHLFARPMPIEALLERLAPGLDGVPARLYPPVHSGTGNVIDLPRPRHDEAADDVGSAARRPGPPPTA
jgi:diguanylate cyclase (GGDEF)-like protein